MVVASPVLGAMRSKGTVMTTVANAPLPVQGPLQTVTGQAEQYLHGFAPVLTQTETFPGTEVSAELWVWLLVAAVVVVFVMMAVA